MFYGRNYYINLLEELLKKPMSSVVTCRGRRRVGKSTLFEEFARRNGCRFLKLEGRAPGEGVGDREQREAFGLQLAEQSPLPRLTPEDWPQAFKLLDSVLFDRSEWTVLLLDEISWMGGSSKTFASDLKIAWDNHLKKHDRLIMVICGSVSSWVTENFVESTGFVGRRSYDFILPELPLDEAVGFWNGVREQRTSREMLDVLSVTGGVPRYLEEMDLSLPADENIRRSFYRPEGYLYQDFAAIFDRVLGQKKERCRRILEVISEGATTVSEIAAALGVERSGYLSADLKNLDVAGFIAGERGINPETGELALQIRYRIKDCYTHFYLKQVLPERERIEKGLYESVSLAHTDGWDARMGRQFETLVLNNFKALLPLIGLSGVSVLSAAPYLKRGRKGEGCQIDLLVQTETIAYVVEIKRKRVIGEGIAADVAQKVSRLPLRKGVSVRTALVYEGELEESLVRRQVFDFLIPARKLLGL